MIFSASLHSSTIENAQRGLEIRRRSWGEIDEPAELLHALCRAIATFMCGLFENRAAVEKRSLFACLCLILLGCPPGLQALAQKQVQEIRVYNLQVDHASLGVGKKPALAHNVSSTPVEFPPEIQIVGMAGTETFARIASELEASEQASRFPGLPYHLERSEYDKNSWPEKRFRIVSGKSAPSGAVTFSGNEITISPFPPRNEGAVAAVFRILRAHAERGTTVALFLDDVSSQEIHDSLINLGARTRLTISIDYLRSLFTEEYPVRNVYNNAAYNLAKSDRRGWTLNPTRAALSGGWYIDHVVLGSRQSRVILVWPGILH